MFVSISDSGISFIKCDLLSKEQSKTVLIIIILQVCHNTAPTDYLAVKPQTTGTLPASPGRGPQSVMSGCSISVHPSSS